MTSLELAALGFLVISTLAYVISAVLFRIGLGRLHDPSGADTPFVSVVIAARNEESYIGACLDSLARQTYPQDRYEVLVVDDDSDDRTSEVAASYSVATVVRPDPQFNDHAAKKRPMATGISRARGELILTTDADCTVPETWIEEVTRCFLPEIDVVIGFSQIRQPRSPGSVWDRLQALDFLALLTAAAGATGLGSALAATGQNFAFRKSLFRRVGGYEEVKHRPSGDDVLLLQLFKRRAGARVGFCRSPGGFATTWRTEAIAGYLRQRRRWASNATAQLRLNPLFFSYIVTVFTTNALIPVALCLGPPLFLAGLVAGTVKLLVDALVLSAGAHIFGRRDLLRLFPMWTLLQPVYIVLVGLTGSLFGFTWKNRRHSHRPSSTDLNHATV